jgi:hypothetical protein
MTNSMNQGKRLPVTFHRSFIPERAYLSSLLKFAASDLEGSNQEISEVTGIPVGKSDGKVPAIISYSLGMGLISARPGSHKSSRVIQLTDFGRSVLLEDTYLTEPLTQWMVHLHLCRESGGAETWHYVFARAFESLGVRFKESQVEEYLVSHLGRRNRALTGPLLRTYLEHSALKNADILIKDNDVFVRNSAPLISSFRIAYSAFFLSLWEECFSDEVQLTITDLESTTYWARLAGWTESESLKALALIQETGAIQLDIHSRPYVINRRNSSSNYWRRIYDELP